MIHFFVDFKNGKRFYKIELGENKMQVQYDDGDEEKLILSNERTKFYISREEMGSLNLSSSLSGVDNDVYDYDEMVVLAASLDDCQEVEAGDIIWAKLTGVCCFYQIILVFYIY